MWQPFLCVLFCCLGVFWNIIGAEVIMVSKKNKRKIEYEGNCYYWYVRINERGHRVHIVSENKKVHLEYPFLDTEVPVTPWDVRKFLERFYENR